METIKNSLYSLINYCESCNFRGYDPYDTLNAPVFKKVPGSFIPALLIQFQKKNPVNIRPFLGIKKGHNPKAMGLFLKAYSLLFKKTQETRYLEKATHIFSWLKTNYSKGYSGYAWGYNFDWASPGSHLKAYTPSVVVTSFVIDGIFEYYKATQNEQAKDVIISAAKFIRNDIPTTTFPEGISFAYTQLSTGACYNASLLAAEVLAKSAALEGTIGHDELIEKAIRFVLSKQKADGSWYYSLNLETGKERRQIDFHQGFVLVSLYNLANLTGILKVEIEDAVKKGLKFYREQQFFPNGRSMARLPKKWPVDIHNQSQGIITFSRLKEFDPDYGDFAKEIALWTIQHMQGKKGYFYYRKTRFFTNKVPYMRWSQAWMMLALCELLQNEDK